MREIVGFVNSATFNAVEKYLELLRKANNKGELLREMGIYLHEL